MHALIGIHAFLGEAGALAFLWVLVELLSPSESRVRRATRIAGIGVLFLFLAWIVGGYYYLTEYQSIVKPVIKAGPLPWTHSVITETKEHVFLFLPFLALGAWSILKRHGSEMMQNRRTAAAAIIVSALIVLMAFSIAGMGFMISSGFRSALESKAL
ncbi:MAG: hypothetical protein G01um10148_1019 [Parcubacteria group bacterium Gr01-1014_8]|nr:MAG: hypothetical protein G01um10148_1019 [Parcubacteria group bacterium Gr01-1014_8]